MPEWKRDLRDVSLQHEYLIYSTSVKNMGGTPSSIEGYAKRRAEGQRIRLKQQKEAAAAKEAEEYQAYLTEWKLNNQKSNNYEENAPHFSLIEHLALPRPTSPIASISSVPSGAAFIYGKPASTRNLENAQNILVASAKPAYKPKPLSLAEFAKQKNP